MTDEPTPDVDRRVRDAFAPDPGAVARVVRGALALQAPNQRRRLYGLATAVAITLLAALLPLWRSRPEPGPEPERAASLSLSGSFTEGILVVSLPDGSASIFGGAEREERPPDGYGIILVEGAFQ